MIPDSLRPHEAGRLIKDIENRLRLPAGWATKLANPEASHHLEYQSIIRERAPSRTSIPVLIISFRIAYRYKPSHPDSTPSLVISPMRAHCDEEKIPLPLTNQLSERSHELDTFDCTQSSTAASHQGPMPLTRLNKPRRIVALSSGYGS